MSSIDLTLDQVKWTCTVCGSTSGCDCWEQCSCGWSALRSEKWCRNPNTIRCSIKLKHGKWNPKTRRYEKREEVAQ